VAWVAATYATRPTDDATLRRFVALVRPGGPGWTAVARRAADDGQPLPGADDRWTVPQGILAMVVGSFAVYAALFAIGSWIYGRIVPAVALTALSVVASVYLVRAWGAV